MSRQIVVIGAGGHGRELLDVLQAWNHAHPRFPHEVLGVVDDNPSELNLVRLKQRGTKVLCSVDRWLSDGDRSVRYLLGLGDSHLRRSMDRRFTAAGFTPASLVHPAAVLGSSVTVGPGGVILGGAVLATNIELGRHTHIHRCATVGHDCIIGDYVTVNPSVSVSGDCVIEDDVLLGVGSATLQGVTIHAGAIVGGAAFVVSDVPAGATVKGVPAR